ncbi:MAG: hypothetical protein RMJ98_09380 [Myxococcales bacterium]|nr:hypothetical protein [Polyangiaceae bacterium]MDW8249498.1 hypothetical protein [Myxococcales bacterium]
MVPARRLPLLSSFLTFAGKTLTSIHPYMAVRYLRVVLTVRCNPSCSFCHMEGNPAVDGREGGLDPKELKELLYDLRRIAVRQQMTATDRSSLDPDNEDRLLARLQQVVWVLQREVG